MSEEHCHAIRVRLTGLVSPQILADRLAAMQPARLWVDDVPATADEPIAEHRRTMELARPAASVRCVLLRYADGQADLIVVARRDQPVRWLAAALIGADVPTRPAQPSPTPLPWIPR